MNTPSNTQAPISFVAVQAPEVVSIELDASALARLSANTTGGDIPMNTDTQVMRLLDCLEW